MSARPPGGSVSGDVRAEDVRAEEEAAAVARDAFGIEGAAWALPGEFDLNFKVAAPGRTVVLKIAPTARRLALELAAACVAHVGRARLSRSVPRLVPPAGRAQRSGEGAKGTPADAGARGASPIVDVAFRGQPHVATAFTWVEGIPLAELRPRSAAVLEALGAFLAELGRSLSGFDHPALDRRFPWRLESARQTVEAHVDLLAPEEAALVRATAERAWRWAGPAVGDLPRGVIHNDANDYNVLIHPSLPAPQLSGVIDFGDVAKGWRVADPAVAAAYAMTELPDPLEAACAVARGCSAERRLDAAECRAFLPLAALRLCLSVCIQARQMRDQPENDYLAVSQAPAWALLRRLSGIDWRLAEFRVRGACGLEPNPARGTVSTWIVRARPRSPIMSPQVLARPCVLDLSAASPDLPYAAEAASVDDAIRWVEESISAANATAGVGRYGEARLLYDAPGFKSRGNDGPEARTVHLGLDVFAPAGSEVRAPLSGTVVSVADNGQELDYGPTVILRHVAECGAGFHTLYGHLDRATLDHLTPGDAVSAGDVVGWLGDFTANGGWPPHLHFQVVALDPLFDPDARDFAAPTQAGRSLRPGRSNFPGVARPRLRALWESVSPDPTALAGLPGHGSEGDDGEGTSGARDAADDDPGAFGATRDPSAEAHRILRTRHARMAPNLGLSYDRPVHVVRGAGACLFDSEGRRYLDTVNNVAHVGHSNPRVARAIARQSRVLNTNTRYLHGEIAALAEELTIRFPAPLEVVFLVCSGSEANELALRLARRHTGREGVVVLEGGYHGNTGGLVEISPYKFDGPGGGGRSARVAVAPMPDPYRGRHRRDLAAGTPDADLGARYAEGVARALAELSVRGPGAAAFVAEGILGCGGQIEPPAGYLQAAYAHTRRAGGVCVADEVQTGFGRVGDAFWSFELQGVGPDIVTLGKPMGNGHPVAAVVTTREIAASFDDGMEYFNTFGGNPVSCAAARAVLAEIRDRELQRSAREVGGFLLDRLRGLADRFPIVGDVRGRGLFLGVELVRDPESRTPFPEAAAYVVNRMRARSVLTSTDGPDANVLKIKPPMVFSFEDAAHLADELEVVLSESALQAAP